MRKQLMWKHTTHVEIWPFECPGLFGWYVINDPLSNTLFNNYNYNKGQQKWFSQFEHLEMIRWDFILLV